MDRAGSEASPDRDLKEALRLLLLGCRDDGLRLYRQGLRAGGLPRAPVGMHLRFLQAAGRTAEAEAVRTLALQDGADLALKAGGFGAPPEEVAAEYEALMAAGCVNSRMVWEYLLLLSRLGRTREVESLLDPALLVARRHVDVDAAATEAVLLRHEASGDYQEAVDSVRLMTKIKKLQTFPDAPIRRLTAALREETATYLERWRAAGHALSHLVPESFEMHFWGLISRGEGFNIRHIHHRGWATGIYYPTDVPEGVGGELRIGCPARLGETAEGWPDIAIRPERGLLVLIPSFYTHWTVPLGRPGLRVSIAFDLAPAEGD